MTYKSPTAALNEVLLQAAIRAERINAEPNHESRARDLARRNDKLAREYNRVPVTSTEGASHDTAGRQPT